MTHERELMRAFADLAAPCCQGIGSCGCTPPEQVLHAYASKHPLPPMTHDQRRLCLRLIAGVPGHDPALWENTSDSDLAAATLRAWDAHAVPSAEK